MERRDWPAGPVAPTFELHIDEVMLRGFSPGDRRRIGDALERELHRLLAEGALPDRLSGDVHVAELDGGRLDLSPGARGEEVGAMIARAVYGGLRSAMASPAGPSPSAAGSAGRGRGAASRGATAEGLASDRALGAGGAWAASGGADGGAGESTIEGGRG